MSFVHWILTCSRLNYREWLSKIALIVSHPPRNCMNRCAEASPGYILFPFLLACFTGLYIPLVPEVIFSLGPTSTVTLALTDAPRRWQARRSLASRVGYRTVNDKICNFIWIKTKLRTNLFMHWVFAWMWRLVPASVRVVSNNGQR